MPGMPPIAVLAGGLGTRLRPVTTTIPKSLVEVAGAPFIAHQLELFARRGIREAVFCVGYLGEQIEDYVRDGRRFGVKVRFSHDGNQLLGTGGALRHALPLLGDEFLATYGDSYLDIAYDEVVKAFRASGAPALMTVFRNQDNWDRSNIEYRDGCVVVYDKKKRTPSMHYIDYGLMVLTPAAFSGWLNAESFDLTEPLGQLARDGHLAAFETMTRFYEAGSPSGIADLAEHLQTVAMSGQTSRP
jgi:N-acetyl-alpha-D-muramate 1-phosphate uridylyltransferase